MPKCFFSDSYDMEETIVASGVKKVPFKKGPKTLTVGSDDELKVWGLNVSALGTGKLDKAIADWYTLNLIRSGALGNPTVNFDLWEAEFSEHATITSVEAHVRFRKLNDLLAEKLEAYAFYTLFRECRYHSTAAKYLSVDRQYATEWGYRELRRLGKEVVTEAFCDLLDPKKNDWDSDFGGQAWYDIAFNLLRYVNGTYQNQPYTKELFLDRFFTLQHNNGSALNKISWAKINFVKEGHYYFESAMNQMLNAQDSDHDYLALNYTTNPVKALYKRTLKEIGD